MHRSIVALPIVLGALLPSTALALPDELETHLDDTVERGELGLELIASFVASGAPADESARSRLHALQLSPDLSYGIGARTEAGVQLFTSLRPSGAGSIDGGRIEVLSVPVRPTDGGNGGWIGALLEVGRLPRSLSSNRLDGEVKLLVGYRRDDWTIASSPEIGFKVSGSGDSRPDLDLKVKAAYRLDPRHSIGLEQYSSLGPVRRADPVDRQSHQTFAVIDVARKSFSVNAGVGRGWTASSDKWTIKAVIEVAFGD